MAPPLFAALNSRLAWFVLFAISNPLRGGTWRLRLKSQYVEQMPIPTMPKMLRDNLAQTGQSCAETSAELFEIQSKVRHRILDLAPAERRKFSRKLEEWWTLDFAGFRAEVKRTFRAEIPVKERADWEFLISRISRPKYTSLAPKSKRPSARSMPSSIASSTSHPMRSRYSKPRSPDNIERTVLAISLHVTVANSTSDIAEMAPRRAPLHPDCLLMRPFPAALMTNIRSPRRRSSHSTTFRISPMRLGSRFDRRSAFRFGVIAPAPCWCRRSIRQATCCQKVTYMVPND